MGTIRAMGTRLAVMTLLGVAIPATAWGQECTDCHDEVQVDEASVHAGFGCADCHTDIEWNEDKGMHQVRPMLGEQICAQCHEAADQIAESVHGEVAGCTDCHGGDVHAVLPASDAASPVAPAKQIGTCGQCHDEVVEAFVDSEHGRGLLKSGLDVAPACNDCHGAHDIVPVSDPESKVAPAHVPETCGACHKGVLNTWISESAHGEAWKAGEENAPVCTTCHSSHDIVAPGSRTVRVESPENCGNCHEEAYHSYLESFHGKATDLGFESAAICADCHTAHQNLPPSDPRSTVHEDNVLATCQSCHPDAGPKFASFQAHDDPSTPEGSKPVFYIFWAMTILLVGTFGAFGLHGLLWFQRSIVALVRGEEKHTLDLDKPWVKRFGSTHRWVHFTIILTFLILAATGLPLKFHWASWAQLLNDVPGMVQVHRILHRIAAVFTFGYAFTHLGWVIWNSRKAKAGMFWGPDSLVPQPQDLKDAVANIRYFLYLGPKPKLDRWTYWEKFDYFAVFWGIPVIGLSGLMLWFPEWFTGWLPGWALNAAFIVHSDEALLATGFIFVFHFFHTHVRPEAFPLDPVMFTGSMPLERFKEERPSQYERMVAEGSLEENLVSPPSEFQLRTIYAFGFVAVVAGVSLAFAIIWGLLTW